MPRTLRAGGFPLLALPYRSAFDGFLADTGCLLDQTPPCLTATRWGASVPTPAVGNVPCRRAETMLPPLGAVGGHPPAHRFGEPRHQQAFDGESKPDRDHEVAKLSPPWPTGPDRPPFPAEASASRNSGRNPTGTDQRPRRPAAEAVLIGLHRAVEREEFRVGAKSFGEDAVALAVAFAADLLGLLLSLR